MIKNKFYKHFTLTLAYYLALIIVDVINLIVYIDSFQYEGSNNFRLFCIFVVLGLKLVPLLLFGGFYWMFLIVIIDEKGIKIKYANKIVKECKWEEIINIDNENAPWIIINLPNGSVIFLEPRKNIIKAVETYYKKSIGGRRGIFRW